MRPLLAWVVTGDIRRDFSQGVRQLPVTARDRGRLVVGARVPVGTWPLLALGRLAALSLQVGGLGPEWRVAKRASRDAVGQELAALRQAWKRGGGRARPHGPHRLVRTEAGILGGPGLWAAEAIGVLRSQKACLEVTLRRLQGQCRQELARLAGALPGLIWILPPGR